MNNLYLVVMAGGSGTRFWPKSVSSKPKQLLSFGEDQHSLLQKTLSRFDGLVPERAENRLIVTTRMLEAGVSLQTRGQARVLAEPQGRNTAPCVYWAAREVAERDPKAVMLVMPSDHYIAKPEAFLNTVRQAAQWATTHDDLVTLGVKPSRPETGYGYLKTAPGASAQGPMQVAAFVEKPNLEKANEFLKAGNYLWNGGMFLWRAEVILKAFDEFMPELKREWEAAQRKVEAAYPKMTATSIDYGVMEKARNVVTFELDCGWDDLGSWISLEGLSDVLGARKKSPAGDNTLSAGELIAIESAGNIVDAPGKMVTLLGVSDLIVSVEGGAVLVARKERAQDIKLIVDQIKKQRPDLA